MERVTGWQGEVSAASVIRNHASDLRGVTRLAFDATAGVTALVEALHVEIARLPTKLGGPIGEAAVNGVTWLVYRSIHGATSAVGGGVDLLLAQLVPMLRHVESSPAREAAIAALNGVLGDHLAETGNPLAIAARLRSGGVPIELTREGLAAAFPAPSAKVVVLVHGLCMSDVQWTRRGHNHGTALARDLGYTPVHFHYNSGRHVSTNGRGLAGMLEALVAAWPVRVDELAIVAHSMGGLVARSAHHYAGVAGHQWRSRLRRLVFLGTPHHGAALERGGHRLQRLFEQTPFTAPFARLGKIRSAGITDLRHGNLLDEDWHGRDRFADGEDARRPLPLPERAACYAVAATTGSTANDLRGRLLGDGLVPLASALGRHRDPRLALAFPESHQWIACRTGHFDLLDHPGVWRRIRAWLAD
ncbi:MAG TPA: alpha/beta hydrolase [Candidatus Binatia bacterium]|nr:alpha/beta hydrolase [Candidatus Binatia bacterium]